MIKTTSKNLFPGGSTQKLECDGTCIVCTCGGSNYNSIGGTID